MSLHSLTTSITLLVFATAIAPAREVSGAETVNSGRKLNVLFIATDDMNCDLSAYGDNQVKTPNLERLAGMGVRFDCAYCQQPLCGPSRASIMTGLRPDTLDIHTLANELRIKNPNVVTIGQLFRRNGYYSARSGKIFHYGNPGQIGTDGNDDPDSWDERHNPMGIDKVQEEKIIKYNKQPGLGCSMSWWDPESKDEEHTDGMVASDVIEMIKENRDRPFFLAAGFFDPHCPYVAPRRYFDLYPLETITLPDLSEAKEDLADVPPMATYWDMKGGGWPYHFGNISVDQARRCKQSYYACISFVDAQVGRLLDALEENNLLENTIIVFWSDHGYFLGEKGLWYKRKAFERAARVPLIIAGPGIARNVSTDKTVELLDLYPTLADLCGLPAPKELQGQSLRPLLVQPSTANWSKPAVTQEWYGPEAWGYSIRTDRWRYTEWQEGKAGRELYDHSTDPEEITNLAGDTAYAETITDLSARLKSYVHLKPYKRGIPEVDGGL